MSNYQRNKEGREVCTSCGRDLMEYHKSNCPLDLTGDN